MVATTGARKGGLIVWRAERAPRIVVPLSAARKHSIRQTNVRSSLAAAAAAAASWPLLQLAGQHARPRRRVQRVPAALSAGPLRLRAAMRQLPAGRPAG